MASNKLLKQASALFFAIFSLYSFSHAADNKYLYKGVILDAKSKKPVPGATIRTEDGKYGTYAAPSGKFRLPLPVAVKSLKVTSLGYESALANVKNDNDTLFVYLKESSILLRDVKVVGDIDVREIIRRAIERKKENSKKIHTFEGMLYSKLTAELDGSVFGQAGGDGRSFSIGASLGEKAPEKYKMFVLEKFCRNFRDFDSNKTHSVIIQRRQTANMTPDQNFMVIGTFIDFTEDEVNLVNTKITTPLANNALNYYNFTLIEREQLDSRYVYVIRVEPSTNLFPTFYGTIKIVEGTYHLIEVDLRPGDATAVPFIDSVQFHQKLDEPEQDLWVPVYLEVTGKGHLDVIKSIMDIKIDLTSTSIYSDVKINKPLPDSIYKQNIIRTTVAPKADSARREFWEQNALREITPKELQIYKNVDSLVALDSTKDSIKKNKNFNFDYGPEFDFNRASSVSVGANIDFSIYGIKLKPSAMYSFGLQKPIGVFDISYQVSSTWNNSWALSAGIYSNVGKFSTDESYPRLATSAAALLFHSDYYDYFLKEGWAAKIKTGIYGVSLNLGFDWARHFSLEKTTNRSIFSNRLWRKNLKAEDGDFRVGTVSAKYNFVKSSDNIRREITLELSGLYGEKTVTKRNFTLLEAKLSGQIPTFFTGYSEMMLDFSISAGRADINTPVQYQFKMPTGLVVYSRSSNFYTAPIAKYGGTEYFMGSMEFNLTDIWWRAIGLPLYEKRGLDLLLAAASGRFATGTLEGYLPTGRDFYSEAGFGISRIPTFVSNVAFLAFQCRWGFGPIAKGNFGYSIGLSLPF
ncbi:MAG: Carboxypeptidase-like regulatory protein [Ignavibacteria bacterium]|nr:Carboxypeptidase-like regulatory protein [Ignavibacteria bacterium]